jgi:hypothetical protein
MIECCVHSSGGDLQVKFFERVKIERRLKALEAEASSLVIEGRSFPPEREEALRRLREDLQVLNPVPPPMCSLV